MRLQPAAVSRTDGRLSTDMPQISA